MRSGWEVSVYVILFQSFFYCFIQLSRYKFRSYDHLQTEIYTAEINATDNRSVAVQIPILATFSAHFIVLNLIILIMFGEEYKLWNSTLAGISMCMTTVFSIRSSQTHQLGGIQFPEQLILASYEPVKVSSLSALRVLSAFVTCSGNEARTQNGILQEYFTLRGGDNLVSVLWPKRNMCKLHVCSVCEPPYS
jgi:hypothetical protein